MRNERDGGVLIEAQGPTDAVAQLLERVQRGPAHARVEQAAVEELPPSDDAREFEIR